MQRLTAEQQDTLEQIIDAASLADVLRSLADICRLKSEHLQSNWQDNAAAKAWDRDADRIESLAGRVQN